MQKRFRITLYALLLVLALSAPCGAAELLQNGGFETGTFSSWTTTPASSGSIFGVSTTDPHTGIYAAYFGAVGTLNDSISQTLATVANQSYSVSFWLALPDARTPTHFSASWGGSTILNLLDPAVFAYTQYTFTETALTSATSLTFSGLSRPAYFYLDDVSVTGPQSVPEPLSMLLMGFGLVGIAGVRRMMRGMQFKTNILEGTTMKTHIRLAVMICGLLLVAAPAMAQVLPPPGIQIFDNDATGITVLTSGGFLGTPVIIQETPGLSGSVTWDFQYSSNRTLTETFSYNIFEQGGAVPPQLSDTLLLTLSPHTVTNFSLGHLVFISGSLNDTPPLNALPGGFAIIETGALQDLLVNNIPHPTDMLVLAFQSDLDPPPTNVPEPASLLLFGFGLVGLAWVRRKEELK